MAGAVIMYNTDLCKMKILKWAFLCALTQSCIAPHGSMKGCGKPNWWMYDQVERYTDAYEMNLDPKKMMATKNKQYYQICHRYDQALMTILWASHLKYNFTSVHIDSEPEIAMANLVRSHDNLLEFDEASKDRPVKVNLSTEEMKLANDIKSALKAGNDPDSDMILALKEKQSLILAKNIEAKSHIYGQPKSVVASNSTGTTKNENNVAKSAADDKQKSDNVKKFMTRVSKNFDKQMPKAKTKN